MTHPPATDYKWSMSRHQRRNNQHWMVWHAQQFHISRQHQKMKSHIHTFHVIIVPKWSRNITCIAGRHIFKEDNASALKITCKAVDNRLVKMMKLANQVLDSLRHGRTIRRTYLDDISIFAYGFKIAVQLQPINLGILESLDNVMYQDLYQVFIVSRPHEEMGWAQKGIWGQSRFS